MEVEQQPYLVNKERNTPRSRIRKVAGYESTHAGLLRSFGKGNLVLKEEWRHTGNDDIHAGQDVN